MFGFFKKMFSCDGCKSESLEKRREDAIQQDKDIRESLSEKQIDKGLKDSMEASDPVAKY